MIVTSKSNELTTHSHILGDGLQVWREVHLEAETPYFLVIYSVNETGSRVRQTCLVSREADLIMLCDQIDTDPNLSLIRVCLFSPPWLNRTKIWKIDPIKKIVEVSNDAAAIRNCYELENDTQLIDSRGLLSTGSWRAISEPFSIDRYRCISDFDSPECIEIYGGRPSQFD